MSNDETQLSQAKRLLSSYRAAMISKDADALAALYCDDAVHSFPFSHDPNADLRGRDAVRARYAAGWARAPVRPIAIREVGLHEGHDEVVVAEHQMDLEAEDGQQFEAAFVLCFELRDGKIAWIRDYLDSLTIAIKLGRVFAASGNDATSQIVSPIRG